MVGDDGSDTEDSFSNEDDEDKVVQATPTEDWPVAGEGGAGVVGEGSGEAGSSSIVPAMSPLASNSSSSSSSTSAVTAPADSASSDTTATPPGVPTEAAKKEDKDEEKRKGGKGKEAEGGGAKEEGPEDKGDPEMAPVYLRRLLPVFTEIYHSSLAPALRKESLRLMRKMCRYVSAKCLQELCQGAEGVAPAAPTGEEEEVGERGGAEGGASLTTADPALALFSARISEVLAAVMETEDDHEAHLSALHIMQDLLGKNRSAFDEQFVRLGLPNKIASLAGLLESETTPTGEEEEDEGEEGEPVAKAAGGKDEIDIGETSSKTEEEEEGKKQADKVYLEDAVDIAVVTPYQWRDWCFVRSRDCLYLWNDYCVIELSNVSNGWFRFLVDNRLATMYSSGSTEGGPDSYGRFCQF